MNRNPISLFCPLVAAGLFCCAGAPDSAEGSAPEPAALRQSLGVRAPGEETRGLLPGMKTNLNIEVQAQLIDLLFIVDNSPAMLNKQALLIKKLQDSSFLNKIITNLQSQTAAVGMRKAGKVTLRIGLVSTDVGTLPGTMRWDRKGSGLEIPNDACETPYGDEAVLQNKACSDRAIASDPRCTALRCADTSTTEPFIELRFDSGMLVQSNVKDTAAKPIYDGATLGKTLSCRVLMGQKGCGLEAPLAALKQALEPTRNPAFFANPYDPMKPRDDLKTLLIPIFLTDEDDCSVANRNASNPYDLDDSVPPTDYRRYTTLTRCFAMSSACTHAGASKPPLDTGTYKSCTATASSYLQDVVKELLDPILLPDLMDKSKIRPVIAAGIWPVNRDNNPMNIEFEVDSYRRVVNGRMQTFPQIKPKACRNPNSVLLPSDGDSWNHLPQHRLGSFMGDTRMLAKYQADICEESDYAALLQTVADMLLDPKLTFPSP